MPSTPELLLLAGLGLWLIATVAGQFPSRTEAAIRYADVFSLVPRWHLFAPRPLRADYLLLFRVREGRSSPPGWIVASCLTPVRRPYAALVNPSRRELKVLLDAVQEFLLVAARPGPRRLEDTPSYAYLLDLIRCEALGADDEHVQFAIVRRDSDLVEHPRHLAVFISRWHPADAASTTDA